MTPLANNILANYSKHTLCCCLILATNNSNECPNINSTHGFTHTHTHTAFLLCIRGYRLYFKGPIETINIGFEVSLKNTVERPQNNISVHVL